VVRSYSPVTTIGGGIILDNGPKKRKRASERDRQANREYFAAFTAADDERRLLMLIETCGPKGITSDQLAARTGVFSKKLKKLLQLPLSTGALVVVDSESQRFLAASVADTLSQRIVTLLKGFHQQHPLETGLSKEALRSQLKPAIDTKVLNSLLSGLVRKGVIEQSGAEIRISGHTVTLQVDEQTMEEEIRTMYREAGLTPPILKDVFTAFSSVPERQVRQVIDLLVKKAALVRINEVLFFHAPAVADLQEKVTAFLRREGDIDAQRFKELTGLTRKFSIPLLEYFDKIKLTIRIDDKRILRKG